MLYNLRVMERSYEGVKKYFRTLEPLKQIEPNYVHILPTTYKGTCRPKVTLAPVGGGLSRDEKIFYKVWNPWSNLIKNQYTYYLQPTKEPVGIT